MLRSKKELELEVQKVPPYHSPKVELEQYVTDASIVAELVWLSYMRHELSEARVLDLGCGTGRFSVAVALVGALQVVCLDIDVDAITQTRDYVRDAGLDSVIDVVVGDATRPPLRPVFSVVFQNPPFGIQSRRGIDIDFLRSAVELGRIVYTIHKAETRDYVIRRAYELGCSVDIIGVRTINIPPIYRHHYKRLHKVNVVLIRLMRTHE